MSQNTIESTQQFVCVAEVLPPKACTISDDYYTDVLDRAAMNGANVFSVTSNPMGTMESGYMAQLIQKRWPIQPCIVHLTCTGRSLLQHQSHLMSLYHSGFSILLVVAGDATIYCPDVVRALTWTWTLFSSYG